MEIEHDYPEPVLDTQYGYAINIPLGEQEPVEFWFTPKGTEIRQYIDQCRKIRGIDIDDHLVIVQPSPESTMDAIKLLRASIEGQTGDNE